ncbi:MAG: pyruvate, phosphate dikinase [Firmicutes bacterium]|jgi:pyruvate,orthophosphate dikinase|nr:pyruvate, phosphate dikinase [Bacillota bacterium]
MTQKYVYFFGGQRAEGKADMRNLLGGKGANLAEMVNIGIPVPAGFTITTEVCTIYYENNQQWPEGLEDQIKEALGKVEADMGKKFGDPHNPLLFGVRSGARVSMPGMMDTVLNLGLNDTTVKGLIEASGDERFAYDCYRRFIQMYGDVVKGVDHDLYEEIIEAKKQEKGVTLDTDLDADDWKDVVVKFKALYKKHTGEDFPEDPFEQLRGSINAVFESWNNPRAITYRELNEIPHDWGTAVNVQAMVFGNMGSDPVTGKASGTGVAFTRDPATGENIFYGEYLMNAQGEDVVAGIRTPSPISTLQEEMPEIYKELDDIRHKLEQHYKEMQDVEFTIQRGKLYMLQTRAGKRTAAAAVRIAVEMVEEGLIDKETAITRIDPAQLDQLLHPMIDPNTDAKVLGKGLPASPGAAVGRIVFNAKDAEEWRDRGEKVVLTRTETSPDDIGGMDAAEGILTTRGGMTSHAAVVARGMGKPCVAGLESAQIRYDAKTITFADGTVLKEGDWVTLNGTNGQVLEGKADLIEPELTGHFATIEEWADSIRSLKIRTNADTPHDAEVARNFGAEGIGLCRTEHMFFAPDRITVVQQMILADDAEARKEALAKLLPMQKGDFVGIFRAMQGLPVTIRLLDPPLHEFLPHTDKDIATLAKATGLDEAKIREKTDSLREANPMLGHRGCRLGITYPEIYDMQVQAIFEAACELAKEGLEVVPEVMIPLIGTAKELEILKENAVKVAEEVMEKAGVKLEYHVGTMIEIPRACLTADDIAATADFFSFGTNDLTQMGFGYSRDDVAKFLPVYIEQGILERDPFQSLDQEGIGQLVDIAVKKGRGVKAGLKLGVCGEHGGDPASIEFFHRVGLDYVSCSPYRVPIARIAAAQAQVRFPR